MNDLFKELGSNEPDNLIAGQDVKILLKGVTLAAGQGVLKRGSVIGIVTANEQGKLCESSATDGSEVAKFILTDEVDTTSEAVVAQCFKTGIFNRNALIFGGTDTAEEHEDELRKYGIHLKDTISY
jgi:hypothetical protein